MHVWFKKLKKKDRPGSHLPILKVWIIVDAIDCELSLRMVTRARKARARKSKSSFPLGQFALSSPAELRLD